MEVQWVVLLFNKLVQLKNAFLNKQTNKQTFCRQKLHITVLKVVSCENHVI